MEYVKSALGKMNRKEALPHGLRSVPRVISLSVGGPWSQLVSQQGELDGVKGTG